MLLRLPAGSAAAAAAAAAEVVQDVVTRALLRAPSHACLVDLHRERFADISHRFLHVMGEISCPLESR